MFIKRNRRASHDATCTSILLVQGERVVDPRPRGRPKKDAPAPKTRVVHRTLANLTHLPEDLIQLIESYCQGRQNTALIDPAQASIGPSYGALAALKALADSHGISKALGSSRLGRLALFLVLARAIHQGSRLSAVRWAQDQAVAQVLGLGSFDEEDLYSALDWLENEQERIETELAPPENNRSLFLYDVTSSYFEGQENELAAYGYNRDGKAHKKQIVVGLLTDGQGEPVSVRVYRGNTADPATVADPIRLIAKNLGAQDVVFVGDRGMLKTKPRKELAEFGFRYLTALTQAQVRTLLNSSVIQLGLFDEDVAEVSVEDGKRLILRCNTDKRERERLRRLDQLAKIEAKIQSRNRTVAEKPRAKPEVSLKHAEALLKTYRLDGFVSASLLGREVRLTVDPEKRMKVELLDGCYVLESDVPPEAANAQDLHDRYMDLQRVERDFRQMKTGMLKLRPIFLRKAGRTRAHALVTMLALKLTRALEKRVSGLGLTPRDALDRLSGIRLVTFADPELELWTLPCRFAQPQREILDALPPLPAPLLSRNKRG